jgi:lysophospholipid acyltransferase (LPLAT)-like uncharacterized protein
MPMKMAADRKRWDNGIINGPFSAAEIITVSKM